MTDEKPAKRPYTLLLVCPKGRSWKIPIPRGSAYVLLAFVLIGIFALTALTESYARMLLKVSNYNNVRADRETLKTKYKLLEQAVRQSNTQLSSLESLASEVALSYGFGKTRTPQAPTDPPGFVPAESAASPAAASYSASVVAFNAIAHASLTPSRTPALLGLLANPLMRPSDIPTIWPVQGEVTAGFGERMDPFSGEGAFHAGIDIAAPEGTAVRATAGGIVIQSGPGEPGYGNDVIIDHGSGIATRYSHLRRIFVVEGQQVQQGEVIGTVGMTGKTTGPHLHYEVLVHETPVNPAKFLRG
ncbi:MAG: M23 family metallopeptidase [Terriglobia bacterium]